MTLVRIIAFLSAFLLFQVEFIIGKILLPNFGGSFMVWGACIVFFQAALLLGYYYAHLVVQRFGIIKYRRYHLIALILPLAFFPGRMIPLQQNLVGLPMVIEVCWKLIITIGPVFLVLSTTSIIVQAWVAHSTLPGRDNPYVLFAVSNLGSFLGLVTYPFIFELFWGLDVQQWIWRVGYLVVIALFIVALKTIRMDGHEERESGRSTTRFGFSSVRTWQWFFYGVAGVVMFLAVTNTMTIEIAPVPLLWMLPLVIYLLSYVLNFKRRPWCPSWIERYIYFIVAAGIVVHLLMVRRTVPATMSFVVLLVVLFLICMFCQRRLFVLRPDPRRLTQFYFVASLGGFVGGMVTTWFVPLVSSGHLEYFLGFFFVGLAYYLEEPVKLRLSPSTALAILPALLLVFGPLALDYLHIAGLLIWMGAVVLVIFLLRQNRRTFAVGLLCVTCLTSIIESKWSNVDYLYSKRNYYGINRVFDKDGIRFLTQGTTLHGAQFLDPERAYIPLAYYDPESPVAKLLINEDVVDRVAFVGLGTGALTMYIRANQRADVYELDPDVLYIAREYFSFLRRTRGTIQYMIGDARVSLERSTATYQIIVVDAFSGDSVPVHLITQEALELYRDRLSEDGVIVFHLTNRYIDLPPVFTAVAASENAYVFFKHNVDFLGGTLRSDWIAVTWDRRAARKLSSEYQWEPVEVSKYRNIRPWSDNYSCVTPYLLRPRGLIHSLGRWGI